MNEQNWQEIAKIFEDAKQQVEALLKPKAATCEDYGEPHSSISDYCGCGKPFKRTKDRNGKHITPEAAIRRTACVNALAGIADPAAFVARIKRLVEHCKNVPLVPFRSSSFDYAQGASVKSVCDWLTDLETLVADAEAVAP